jgi:Tfp pilus assembly protein PilN
LVLAAGFGLWRLGVINAKIDQLNVEIRGFEQDKAEMAQIQQQMQALDAQAAMLQARLKVINDLERNQQGPIILLESVGVSVSKSETIWLTSMIEQQGGKIEFKGNAGSMEAIADLMTEFNRSAYFKDVEIKESTQQALGDADDAGTFEFTLEAVFALPVPEEEGEVAEDAAAASAAGGGA